MQKFNVFQKHQKAIILHVGCGRDLVYSLKMVALGVAETCCCNTYITTINLCINRLYSRITYFTGVLISPQPDQKGNKLQRQKIFIFIYPIYNHNWGNISTIYIYIYVYNKTSIKQNTLGSRSGKGLISAPVETQTGCHTLKYSKN